MITSTVLETDGIGMTCITKSGKTSSHSEEENSLCIEKKVCRGFNTEETDANLLQEFVIENEILFDCEQMFLNKTLDVESNNDWNDMIWPCNEVDERKEEELGICAPPTVVEGYELEVPNSDLEIPSFHSASETDILKWIIDDQQIDLDLDVEMSNLADVPVILADDVAAETAIKEEAKYEAKGEDEKYRRMRDQNNEASRRCRLNRKRKKKEMEEECQLLEERNEFLKQQLAEMDAEVKNWKKRLILDIRMQKEPIV